MWQGELTTRQIGEINEYLTFNQGGNPMQQFPYLGIRNRLLALGFTNRNQDEEARLNEIETECIIFGLQNRIKLVRAYLNLAFATAYCSAGSTGLTDLTNILDNPDLLNMILDRMTPQLIHQNVYQPPTLIIVEDDDPDAEYLRTLSSENRAKFISARAEGIDLRAGGPSPAVELIQVHDVHIGTPNIQTQRMESVLRLIDDLYNLSIQPNILPALYVPAAPAAPAGGTIDIEPPTLVGGTFDIEELFEIIYRLLNMGYVQLIALRGLRIDFVGGLDDLSNTIITNGRQWVDQVIWQGGERRSPTNPHLSMYRQVPLPPRPSGAPGGTDRSELGLGLLINSDIFLESKNIEFEYYQRHTLSKFILLIIKALKLGIQMSTIDIILNEDGYYFTLPLTLGGQTLRNAIRLNSLFNIRDFRIHLLEVPYMLFLYMYLYEYDFDWLEGDYAAGNPDPDYTAEIGIGRNRLSWYALFTPLTQRDLFGSPNLFNNYIPIDRFPLGIRRERRDVLEEVLRNGHQPDYREYINAQLLWNPQTSAIRKKIEQFFLRRFHLVQNRRTLLRIESQLTPIRAEIAILEGQLRFHAAELGQCERLRHLQPGYCEDQQNIERIQIEIQGITANRDLLLREVTDLEYQRLAVEALITLLDNANDLSNEVERIRQGIIVHRHAWDVQLQATGVPAGVVIGATQEERETWTYGGTRADEALVAQLINAEAALNAVLVQLRTLTDGDYTFDDL
jgi:hypothetical protein